MAYELRGANLRATGCQPDYFRIGSEASLDRRSRTFLRSARVAGDSPAAADSSKGVLISAISALEEASALSWFCILISTMSIIQQLP